MLVVVLKYCPLIHAKCVIVQHKRQVKDQITWLVDLSLVFVSVNI